MKVKRLLGKVAVGLLVGSMVFGSPVTAYLGVDGGTAIVAEAASAKKVKLNKTSLKLTKGKSYTLKVANASGKKVKWSTKSKKIATVSSKGKVTAKGKGTTYVYARVGGKTLKCKVVVSVPAPKLSRSSVTLNRGKSYTLKVSNASSRVRWSSKNRKIATVSSKGKVTAKGKGTTYVYAKVGKKTLKCKVTVKEPAVVREYTLDSGKSKSLTFSGATSKTRWKVSDPSIATLSATRGKKVTLKVKKSGKVTVTATTSGRKPYRFEITVKGNPETLPSKPTPSQTEAPQTETNPPQTETNPTQTETPETLPSQTEPTHPETNPPQTETNPPQPETPKPPVETEKPVEPSKPNSNEVYDAGIDLDSPLVGDTGRVYAYPVSGMEGYFYGISYSSSNPSVASVDSSGNIECLAEGTTIITVRGDDGVTIDKFTITVTKSESGEKPENFMEVDESISRLITPYTDMLNVGLHTSVPIDRISYRLEGVNSKIPGIYFWESLELSGNTVWFRFRPWIAGTYRITFTAPDVAPVTVAVTVTTSDPDWVEYNNWMYGMLSSEWKADTRLDTFLKMGAWLVDNRDYDASNTQFQRLWRDGVGGDCVAYTMLFTDVAQRIFGLKAYNSNPGAGHEKAIVEIGDEKWGFDAGFTGLAGERRFTAVEINRKEQWKYSTEMTADGLVRGWTHRTS